MLGHAREVCVLAMKRVASHISLKVIEFLYFLFDESMSSISMSTFVFLFIYIEDSTKVIRGCTIDMGKMNTQWCNEEDGCEICLTPGCNVEAVEPM